MEILESDNGFAEAKNEEVQNENTLSNYNIYRKLCYHAIFTISYSILILLLHSLFTRHAAHPLTTLLAHFSSPWKYINQPSL